MMKHLLTAAALTFAMPALANAVVGQPAPAFTATDSNGRSVSLSDYKGKTVVLEWTNAECPFVQKYYSGGDMQKLQAEARAQGPSLLGALPGPAVLIGPDEGVFEANAAALAHHPPLVRETGGESGRLSLAGWENAEFIRARIGLAARFGRGVDLTLRPRDPALPEKRLQAVPTSWHGAAALLVTLDPAGDDPPSRDPHALIAPRFHVLC